MDQARGGPLGLIAPIRKLAIFAGASPRGLSVVRKSGAGLSEAATRLAGVPESSSLTTWQKRWLWCAVHARFSGDSTCTGEPNRSASSNASADDSTAKTPTCTSAIHAAPTRRCRRRVECWMNTPAAFLMEVA